MAFLLSTLTCIRNNYTANTKKYKTFFNVYIWEQKLTDLIRLRTWDWQRWQATPSACRSAYCCGDGKYDSKNKALETIMPHYQSPGDKTKPWCWKQCAIGPETGRHFGYHRRHGICNQHNCATLSACCSAYWCVSYQKRNELMAKIMRMQVERYFSETHKRLKKERFLIRFRRKSE